MPTVSAVCLLINYNFLTDTASHVAESAYSPYSGFKVGAVAVFKELPHTLFHGVNVENASYGLTICAERAAIFAGVANGGKKLAAVAIACKNKDNEEIACFQPCGACLQVISEFADQDTLIFLHKRGEFKLANFLPAPFTLK